MERTLHYRKHLFLATLSMYGNFFMQMFFSCHTARIDYNLISIRTTEAMYELGPLSAGLKTFPLGYRLEKYDRQQYEQLSEEYRK